MTEKTLSSSIKLLWTWIENGFPGDRETLDKVHESNSVLWMTAVKTVLGYNLENEKSRLHAIDALRQTLSPLGASADLWLSEGEKALSAPSADEAFRLGATAKLLQAAQWRLETLLPKELLEQSPQTQQMLRFLGAREEAVQNGIPFVFEWKDVPSDPVLFNAHCAMEIQRLELAGLVWRRRFSPGKDIEITETGRNLLNQLEEQDRAALKAEVALNAMTGNQSPEDLSLQFGVAASDVVAWRDQLIAEAATIFKRPLTSPKRNEGATGSPSAR